VAQSRGARDRGRPPRRAVVAVLLKIYAHCIDGQADAANQCITDALGSKDTRPDPGARKTAKVKCHPERRRSKAAKARIGA